MAWLYLCVAGLFEIAWAIGLKYTEGFTRLWPSAWTVAAMIASFLFLAEALKTIPVEPAMRSGLGSGQQARRSWGSCSSENLAIVSESCALR